jgi:pimeloyl-ACP methyl ester carboxylesterase
MLLLLNGWMASGVVWPTTWLRQLEARFRVVRIDTRGTGLSLATETPFTIAELADDARDVLRACGVDRATVLGYSMGGLIAQELALRHPRYVEELILVGTTPPIPARISPDYPRLLAGYPAPAWSRLLVARPRPDDVSELLARAAGPGFAETHPALVRELSLQLRRQATSRSAAVAQARAIASWRSPSRLAGLAIATTVVHGACDLVAPVANGRRLAQLIPDARYEELPGVGHLVPHEDGDALLRVVGLPAPACATQREAC